MFGKRKQPPSGTEPPHVGIEPQRPREEAFPIVVRRSEADLHLTEAVARFVEAMLDTADYSRSEIPARALQLYDCEDYLGQVNNGGHSQFIGNRVGQLQQLLPSIRAGLVDMAANMHVAVLDGVAAWMKAHPEEIGRQTGFSGGRAPELIELDRQFRVADASASLEAKAAAWIAKWPELEIVEDDDYDNHVERAKARNPLRKQRKTLRSVMAFEHQLSDRLQVGVGLACAKANEFKVRLWQRQNRGAGGERRTLIHVTTNVGHDRIGVVTDRFAALHQRLVEGSYDLGERLSQVDQHKIGEATAHARDHNLAVGLDLVLRKNGLNPDGLAVTPISVNPSESGPVMTVGLIPALATVLLAVSGSRGLILINAKNDQVLANVDPRDIAGHAREVDRGRV